MDDHLEDEEERVRDEILTDLRIAFIHFNQSTGNRERSEQKFREGFPGHRNITSTSQCP